MKIALTNLANQLFEESRKRLNDSARRFGINEINSYDFEDIKTSSFYSANRKILDQQKGVGYWLWKPYIILETMKNLSLGDIVVYADAGLEIIGDLQPLITICREQEPIVLFANGNFTNELWTKRDCFILMACDREEHWHSIHCDAAFSLFRKTEQSTQFLNEWLTYGADERIITDMPNTCGKENLPGFIEHRWDQAILSLLACRHHLPLFRMPTQFGNHYKAPGWRVKNEFNCVNQLRQKQVRYYAKEPYYNSPYGQLLDHHRTKTGEKSNNTDILGKLKRMFRRL